MDAPPSPGRCAVDRRFFYPPPCLRHEGSVRMLSVVFRSLGTVSGGDPPRAARVVETHPPWFPCSGALSAPRRRQYGSMAASRRQQRGRDGPRTAENGPKTDPDASKTAPEASNHFPPGASARPPRDLTSTAPCARAPWHLGRPPLGHAPRPLPLRRPAPPPTRSLGAPRPHANPGSSGTPDSGAPGPPEGPGPGEMKREKTCSPPGGRTRRNLERASLPGEFACVYAYV